VDAIGLQLRQPRPHRQPVDPRQWEGPERRAASEGAPEVRIATVDQVAGIAGRVPPRYRALVLVAAFGGLRWGELVGLRRKRVDLERGTVTVAEQLLEVNGAFSVGPPRAAPAAARSPSRLWWWSMPWPSTWCATPRSRRRRWCS
jgi:integrase